MKLRDLLAHLRPDTTIQLINYYDQKPIMDYTSLRKSEFNLKGEGCILRYYDCKIGEIRPWVRTVEKDGDELEKYCLKVTIHLDNMSTCDHEFEYFPDNKKFVKCKKCGEIIKSSLYLEDN